MYFSYLGSIALILALGFACYTLIVGVLGGMRHAASLVDSAKNSILVVAFFMLLAAAALITSFLTHDFGVSYVWQHSSLSMPWYYTTSAFYGGQEGSLLYWGLMLSIFSAIFVLTAKRAPKELVPYVMATLMGVEVFLLIVLTTVSNPFVRLAGPPPVDGNGLNPLLMDPGMLVHPPTLLMGYMSFSVPFAFAVAAMITGKLSSEWLRSIRRWMLASWSIQTAGLLLGAWWAYHVLGWGGYWGWDPVENAALLPWLTATAFLHSTMVQERRGMLKIWNLCLVMASFALSIFGTFEVRSGIISSVHSFAYSAIGSYFLVFLVVIIVFSTGLFLFRLPKLQPEQEFDAIVSREGMFLVNNLLLLGITFATLWGTIFPLISATLRRQTMTVGPPFYNNVNGPLSVLLLLAMGIGPLLAWRRTSLHSLWRNLSVPVVMAAVCALILPLVGINDVGANIGFSVCTFTAGAIVYELWRGTRVRHSHGEPYLVALYMLFNRYRQRYGGYLVHLGLLMLAVGVIGSHFFQLQQDKTLAPGQETMLAGYRLVYLGNIDKKEQDKESITAQLQIWRDGQLQRYIYPGRTFYQNFPEQPASQVSITTVGLVDLYVFLENWHGSSQATIHIYINPLTTLVWFGGLLMLIGGVICWWPKRGAGMATRLQTDRVAPTITTVAPTRRYILTILAVLALVGALWSYMLLTASTHQTLDQRVHEVAAQLKCPVCQSESVADSPSQLAQQMRDIIRQKLQTGQSEQQIIQFFTDRYGEQIVWSPSWWGFSLLAWLIPIVLLIGGTLLLVATLRDWRRSSSTSMVGTTGEDDTTLIDMDDEADNTLQEVDFDYQLGNIIDEDYRIIREKHRNSILVALKTRSAHEQALDELIEEQLRKAKEHSNDEL